MDLLREMEEMGFDVQVQPMVHCKLFEDNVGVLEQARVAKYRPRMRHINFYSSRRHQVPTRQRLHQTSLSQRLCPLSQDHLWLVTVSTPKEGVKGSCEFFDRGYGYQACCES
jgi:hypothetical protein